MLDKIEELVEDEAGFEVQKRSGRLRVGLPCSPLSLIFEETPSDDVFMALHCSALRIFNGDRTDLHDVCSWLAASFLRWVGVTSSALIDIEHPATMIPAELYGRYLIPSQPEGYVLAPSDAGLHLAGDMIGYLAMFERAAHTHTSFWHPKFASALEPTHDYDAARSEADDWAQDLASLLGDRASRDDIYTQRPSAGWFYYRTTDGAIAVVESKQLVDFLKLLGTAPDEEIAGINGFLYTGKSFDNFIPRDALKIADRIFRQDGTLAASSCPAAEATVVPLENGVILAKGHRAILLRHDTGKAGFARERSLVLERNRLEQERLFPPSEFTWTDEVDGGRFERLIYDLLECEPGVHEVRAIGSSREGDGGRDLVASWVTPPMPGEAIRQGLTPARERRLIIQCKARKRSVGRSDLGGGILDTLFIYQAEGYFLATSSQPAVAVIDLLEEVQRRGDYFTGWWGRTEIEQRLRRYPQILKRYADIVRPAP
ncbi:restriction endonuclease [Streptomyces sp. gb14]|uniref:restriction endonuclease n=1 Tax=Streptomyces sp. gb14 TaxID=1827753 RepID=UPI000BEF951D|nr:restriction endonuclease [Streptomyces sp. gb14]